MSRRSKTAALVAVAAVALGIAACGGSTPASTHASTTTQTTAAGQTVQEQGQRFLALVAPINAAVTAVNKKYPNITDVRQLETLVAPLNTFDDAVLRLGLTGQAATDVRTLVAADAAVLSDIQGGDGSMVIRDEAAVGAADSAVRADLGLAPVQP